MVPRGGASLAVRSRAEPGNEEPADGETLTAAEEERVREMAERAKLPVEAVRRQFLDVRRSRRG